jgi:hypothetical protein
MRVLGIAQIDNSALHERSRLEIQRYAVAE